ncbi:hypothetical protein EYD10_01251 [Varanus komodoensis]|nr:hypothetical protein EYD10_01251 [Varanus komodoensis]
MSYGVGRCKRAEVCNRRGDSVPSDPLQYHTFVCPTEIVAFSDKAKEFRDVNCEVVAVSKGNAKECSNYRTIALISHASKVMLRILQARLQQYVDRELPEVQAGLRRGRGTRDQIANIRWIMEEAREFQKNICFIDYAKAFDCVDHNQVWQVLKEMGVPDHLICLLKNLYAGQEATVRTGHGTTDWFKIRKGVWQRCILPPCLFNLYAEHIMRKAGLDESPVGIKIARRNISNLRYADDTTLMAESEEELKSLLMRVKEESTKVGLKLNIKKTKIMASQKTFEILAVIQSLKAQMLERKRVRAYSGTLLGFAAERNRSNPVGSCNDAPESSNKETRH